MLQRSERQAWLFNSIVVLGLLLTAFSSLKLYFTWSLPLTVISTISFVSCFLYIAVYRKIQYIPTYKFVLCCILSMVFLYEIVFIVETLPALFVTLVSCFICNFVIIVENDTKKMLLDCLVKTTQIMVAVSLLWWILFLLGYSLPHYYSETDAFYVHTVYYLFLLNGVPMEQVVPRFAGFFMEPGHLGTTCCFILYINKFKFRDFGNIVLLLGVLFSLSLAAYGLLIGGYALYLFLYAKRGLRYLLLFIIAVVVIWFISYNYRNGDNYLYMKIFSRLAFEDGEMVGNNRVTSYFEEIFANYMNSSDIWLGKGRDAFASNGIVGTLYGCAGWQRFLYVRGISGIVLLMFFLYSYLRRYYTRLGLGFFILYIVANGIRDYPLKEYWLFFYLLALPLFSVDKNMVGKYKKRI